MILGKVLSRVVSTAKLDSLPKRPLLVVEALENFGEGGKIVAIDTVEAGPGDTVIVLQEGTGSRQVICDEMSQPLPVQRVIVGVVDQINA